MTDVIPAPDTPRIPVRGGGTFPVRRIYCVGRNFADHAKEMGATIDRGQPVFFCKPADAIVVDGVVPYPPGTHDLHYEVELVVALGHDAPVGVLDPAGRRAQLGADPRTKRTASTSSMTPIARMNSASMRCAR